MAVLIGVLVFALLLLVPVLYVGAVLIKRQDKKGESFFKVFGYQLRLRTPQPDPPPEPPAQVFAFLEKEMKAVGSEVTGLLGHRWMYEQVVGMIRRNPALQVESSFYSWMRGQYAAAQSIGVRRLVDRRDDSSSLKNILQKIIDNAHLFTQARHAAFYTSAGHDPSTGIEEFARFCKPGETVLDKDMVEADLKGIEGAAAPIRDFVNRRIAHLGRVAPGKLPTYDDLHAAIDTYKAFGEKYRLLVLCLGGDLTPTYLDDWHAPFRVTWDP